MKLVWHFYMPTSKNILLAIDADRVMLCGLAALEAFIAPLFGPE